MQPLAGGAGRTIGQQKEHEIGGLEIGRHALAERNARGDTGEPGLGKGPMTPPFNRLIVSQIAADLALDVVEACVRRRLRQAAQLGVVIAQPAGGGGATGVTVGQQIGLALGSFFGAFGQQSQGLRQRDAVGDVAEVDAAHRLLGAHVGRQFPHRFADRLGRQIPHGIDDSAGGQVDHAFVGARSGPCRRRSRPDRARRPGAPSPGSPRSRSRCRAQKRTPAMRRPVMTTVFMLARWFAVVRPDPRCPAASAAPRADRWARAFAPDRRRAVCRWRSRRRVASS